MTKFKYHPNLEKDSILTKSKGVCQCCGKEVNAYISNMYCIENIDCICLDCIHSGKAALKFDGTFIQDVETVLDKEKSDELLNCTPGYSSWQGEYWLTCCNDYCAYIGNVGSKELEEMGIADEVFQEYDKRNAFVNARKYLSKEGSLTGYLFQCLHCGKYHLWVDAD